MPVRTEEWRAEFRARFAGARDPKAMAAAVVAFHRRVDQVVAASVQGHAVPVACARGCHLCCSLQVQVQPHEAFALAAWLRRNLTAPRLEGLLAKLRDNAARTEAMGPEARRRANLPCALLAADGACGAYEARPAQCRKFHSPRVATCEASHANPADDSIASPEHPAVAHNAGVVVALARHAVREAGLDDGAYDLNGALLEALANPKAERRWRDGKKAFTGPGCRA
jgi:Putative zinc- or iron-chelating domain